MRLSQPPSKWNLGGKIPASEARRWTTRQRRSRHLLDSLADCPDYPRTGETLAATRELGSRRPAWL